MYKIIWVNKITKLNIQLTHIHIFSKLNFLQNTLVHDQRGNGNSWTEYNGTPPLMFLDLRLSLI